MHKKCKNHQHNFGDDQITSYFEGVSAQHKHDPKKEAMAPRFMLWRKPMKDPQSPLTGRKLVAETGWLHFSLELPDRGCVNYNLPGEGRNTPIGLYIFF